MSDLIDRQTAICIASGYCHPANIAKELAKLPSAQPERIRGRWVDCNNSEHWKCSQCGCRAGYWFNEENSSSYETDMSEWLSDFCPNCGADMRESKDG